MIYVLFSFWHLVAFDYCHCAVCLLHVDCPQEPLFLAKPIKWGSPSTSPGFSSNNTFYAGTCMLIHKIGTTIIQTQTLKVLLAIKTQEWLEVNAVTKCKGAVISCIGIQVNSFNVTINLGLLNQSLNWRTKNKKMVYIKSLHKWVMAHLYTYEKLTEWVGDSWKIRKRCLITSHSLTSNVIRMYGNIGTLSATIQMEQAWLLKPSSLKICKTSIFSFGLHCNIDITSEQQVTLSGNSQKYILGK